MVDCQLTALLASTLVATHIGSHIAAAGHYTQLMLLSILQRCSSQDGGNALATQGVGYKGVVEIQRAVV